MDTDEGNVLRVSRMWIASGLTITSDSIRADGISLKKKKTKLTNELAW